MPCGFASRPRGPLAMSPAVLLAVVGALFEAEGLTTVEWKRRSIYQIVTDRFALEAGAKDTCDDGDCEYGNYCGGTYRGVLEKLDYIQGMGYDAIWLSPLNDNVQCGYHGYWTRHFLEFNDHFGGEDDYKMLVDAAHDRGMAIMADVVLNHVGPSPKGSFGDRYYPFRESSDFHGNVTNHCHADDHTAGMQDLREVCWAGATTIDLALPDLRTENEHVASKLIGWVDRLKKLYGIDGFRLDAVPYMNKTFMQRLKKEALSDTYTVGEVLISNQPLEYLASYQKTTFGMTGDAIADHAYGPVLDGVLNYALWGDLQAIFHDDINLKQEGALGKLPYDWFNWQSTFSDIGALANFVDNHDVPRFVWTSEISTYKNAFVAAFFLPGIPIGLYGSEQGIKGGQADYEVRAPFWRHANYDTFSELYEWTRRAVFGRKFMLQSLDDAHIDEVRMFKATAFFLSFHRGGVIVILNKKTEMGETEIIVDVPTDLPHGTVVCDTLQPEWMAFERCTTVTAEGFVQLGLSGSPRVMVTPGDTMLMMSKNLLAVERWLNWLWLLPLVALAVAAWTQRQMIRVVHLVPPAQLDGKTVKIPVGVGPKVVLHAAVEHVIIPHQGAPVKVVAGGLGKVMGLMCQYHPGAIYCVHPCMCEKDYSFAVADRPMSFRIAGEQLLVKLYKYERPDIEDHPKVTFYLVDHPVFRNRHNGVYPTTMTQRDALVFFSLWNQCVAKLVDRLRPDVFHCHDFHAAMALMYLQRPLPVVVTLHNADYQGAITTQQMGKKEARWFSEIFDLPEDRIVSECFNDATFNMLKPAVMYVKKYQGGYGICGVSKNYAEEVRQKHSIFWVLPEIRGIDNCMPESERMAMKDASEDDYRQRKREAKLAIQRQFNLVEDADARIFVFLGRWVKQKGMDFIADVTEWMLESHAKAQLVMIGPVGDSYGSYTRMRMEGLSQDNRFKGRLFAYAGFLAVPADLKLACDFCLMPSRDEPFGYVDIEFAWFGAAVLGSFRGGLGKLPGFYFTIMDANSAIHIQEALKQAISAAMHCNAEVLELMSQVARASVFPVDEWQEDLRQFYALARQSFKARQTKILSKSRGSGRTTNRTPLLQDNASSSLEQGVLQLPPPKEKPQLGSRLPPIASMGDMSQYMEGDQESVGSLQEGEHDPPTGPVRLSDFDQNSFPLGLPGSGSAVSGALNNDMDDAISLVSVETTGPRMKNFSRQTSEYDGSVADRPGRSLSDVSGNSAEIANLMDIFKYKMDNQSEFLRQEANEESVQGFVEAKAAISTFTKQAAKHAQVLLEETQWELELARETDPYTVLLGKVVAGFTIVDWIISAAYITGPLVVTSLMYLVTLDMPRESATHNFAVTHLLAEALFVIIWTWAATRVRPNLLMAGACFSRLGILAVAPFAQLPSVVAITLGAISANDVLFIYFNFMAASTGDISKVSVRIGFLIAMHSAFKWLGIPMGASSGKMRAMCAATAAMSCLVFPLFLLKAPACYRDFRLPNFRPQVRSLLKVRVLLCMIVSNLAQGLTHTSSMVFMIWRASNPEEYIDFQVSVVVGAFVGPLMLAIVLQTLPNAATNIVKAFACFSFPAVFMRARPMANTHGAFIAVGALDMFCVIAVFMDSLYNMSAAVVVQSTAGSRWRFVAYTCIVMSGSCLAQAASFWILQTATGTTNFNLLGAIQSPGLGNHVFLAAAIPSAIDLASRMLSYMYFDKENTAMLWTRRMTKTRLALGEVSKGLRAA